MESLASYKTQSWLSWFLRGTLILGFLFLFARLFELQVIKGDYFRSLSEGNRIRKISIVAPRGRILARGGEILVGNKEVKKAVKLSPEGGFIKSADLKGASPDEIITEWERDYILGSKFAHVSGYLGEANSDEVGKINPRCPEKGPITLGALIGRSGLEQEYNCELGGIDGEELVEVDTGGRKIRTLGRREPIPGKDIKTTIHIGLQGKVSSVFKETRGAAIVSDAKGEILALYSSPSFDPTNVPKYLKDASLPLFNRAIGGLFHPGSVLKPIVAVAGLSEGKINEDYTYDDPGIIRVGERFSYANWYFTQYGGLEGRIDIVRAIARSTDTFFYKLGELVGIAKLNFWLEKFGLDEETGIDLPGEIAGLVPTPEWKLRVKKEPWFLGNTYHLSIGQGDLAVTPVEINRALLAVAKGELCALRINKDAEDGCSDLEIKREILEIVKRGMIAACSPGGTGFTFFDFQPQVACKTGTAETNEDGKTHAWFTVYAPVDVPEIVGTFLVERGGEGSRVAGPIAREILDYWFHP